MTVVLLATFFFGTIIGSFLNVVIFRVQKKKGIVYGRSACPLCDHKLGVHELFPVLSFIVQGGKCRRCKGNIMWQYPLVEIATGILFAGTMWLVFSQSEGNFAQEGIELVRLWWIVGVAIVLFVYDLKHYIIPNKIIYPGLVVLAIIILGQSILTPEGLIEILPRALLAGIAAGALFWLAFAVSKGKWIGGGDVKLALFLGLALSFPGVIVGLFLAFVIGALVAAVLLATKKKSLSSKVPFGTLLTTGIVIGLFAGEQIAEWYLSLLG